MRTAPRLPADASTSGSGDALDLLERDHRRLEAMFTEAALAALTEREALVRRIADALRRHADLEEQLVYPVIARAMTGGEALARQASDDHALMTALLDDLDEHGFAGDDPRALEVLRRLELTAHQHVASEEGGLFPAFRRIADTAALDALRAAADELRTALAHDAGTRPTDEEQTR